MLSFDIGMGLSHGLHRFFLGGVIASGLLRATSLHCGQKYDVDWERVSNSLSVARSGIEFNTRSSAWRALYSQCREQFLLIRCMHVTQGTSGLSGPTTYPKFCCIRQYWYLTSILAMILRRHDHVTGWCTPVRGMLFHGVSSLRMLKFSGVHLAFQVACYWMNTNCKNGLVCNERLDGQRSGNSYTGIVFDVLPPSLGLGLP